MNVAVRASALLLLAATVAGSGAPAHADEWVLVGSGSAPAAAGVVPADQVIAAINGVAGSAGCVPKKMGIEVDMPSYTTWWEPTQHLIAYEWTGSGMSYASDDCATSVSTTAMVSDYAPHGEPPVVRSKPVTVTSTTPDADHVIRAFAASSERVLYYDLDTLYMRGDSLIEVKISGSYRSGGKTYSIGCMETYTSVTATPTGPSFNGTTEPAPCQ